MMAASAPGHTFLDAVVEAIERAGRYNHNDQVAPAAVLWTDKEREWEALLPRLRSRLPALLTLGPYVADERSGPAYWLRCVLAGAPPSDDRPSLRTGEKSGEGVRAPTSAAVTTEPGDCLLFSDGLRFDVAQLLRQELDGRGLAATLDWRFSALPTVTATAKPAISPVAARLGPGDGFDAATLDTGSRATAPVLRRLLADAGYQVLADEEYGDPNGRAWTELGDIDAYCHEHGWKVSHQLAAEVRALATRIVALLEAGWRRVVVVTDHGWLLLPGGLPKVELPEQLTELRKGRCALLKPFACTDQPTVPWFWDSGVTVAVASGIACFEAGREAEHGGVSPQECVAPVLSVSRLLATTAARIDSVRWKGLVCHVTIAGGAGLRADLRTRAGDAATSITTAAKTVDDAGAASLPVPDDDQQGVAAFVVVLAPDGSIAAQMLTTVGG